MTANAAAARYAKPASWRVVLAALLLPLAGACSVSSSPDDGIDYKSAGVRAPLDVPPDLVNPARGERTQLTAGARDTNLSDYRRERQIQSGRPEVAGVLPTIDGAQMKRDGALRWLRVELPADQVWPIVREFWLDNGFLIARESPQVGILETDWAENRAKIPTDVVRNTLGRFLDTLYSTGERDRFRTRLDDGDGATEIFIAHRGMEEVFTDAREEQTRWQPRPNDPGLEVEFLRRLMLRFGTDEETSRRAVAAVTDADPVKLATLVGNGADSQLDVREPFDRAWRRVGLALDRGGFTVEDRNRADGHYFVRYIDPTLEDKQPGFFARVFGGQERIDASQQYRIRVAERGEQANVTVRLSDGQEVPEGLVSTAERMLRVLEEQLNN